MLHSHTTHVPVTHTNCPVANVCVYVCTHTQHHTHTHTRVWTRTQTHVGGLTNTRVHKHMSIDAEIIRRLRSHAHLCTCCTHKRIRENTLRTRARASLKTNTWRTHSLARHRRQGRCATRIALCSLLLLRSSAALSSLRAPVWRCAPACRMPVAWVYGNGCVAWVCGMGVSCRSPSWGHGGKQACRAEQSLVPQRCRMH